MWAKTMHRKQIIGLFFLFLASFIVFLILLFPYDRAATYLLHQLSKKYSINITYNALTSGLTQTKIKNLTVNLTKPIKISELRISYSPLALITKTAKINASNFGMTTVKFSGNYIKAKGKINLVFLKTFISQIKNGAAEFKLQINKENKKGKLKLRLTNLALNTKLGQYTIETAEGKINIDNNILKIERFSSNGNIKIDLKGKVVLDLKNLEYSRLYITGHMNIKGIKQNFRITGTLSKPKIN